MRDDFRQKTIDTVAKRAGFRCSNPNCRKLTVGSHDNQEKSTLVGVAAHITAASTGGPRFDENLTPDERRNINNAIWLCVNCSTLIDKNPTKYPIETLRKWKESIESESINELENNKAKKTPAAFEDIFTRKSIAERAGEIKELKKKQIEREFYLQSSQAIIDAREEVKKVIARLKEHRSTLEDPTNGFYLGFNQPREDVYEFGYKGYYICFNWSNPNEYDINKAPLKLFFYIKQGTYPFDYKEIHKREIVYKFSRDLDGQNGWVDFQYGSHFQTTADLVDDWVDQFMTDIEQM